MWVIWWFNCEVTECPQMSPPWDNSGELSVCMVLAHTFTGIMLFITSGTSIWWWDWLPYTFLSSHMCHVLFCHIILPCLSLRSYWDNFTSIMSYSTVSCSVSPKCLLFWENNWSPRFYYLLWIWADVHKHCKWTDGLRNSLGMTLGYNFSC